MAANNGKVAIITGAAKGIGAAIAVRFAADGFAVIVNYATSATEAAGVVAEIERGGGRAIAVQADVADRTALPRLFDAAEVTFGGVDVLVNNAGIMRLAPIADVVDSELDAHIATNIAGVFYGLREGARRIRTGGRIISLSSSVIPRYPPNFGIYTATKAAVEALTHILSKELGPRGITVNAIAPGPVGTDLFFAGKTQAMVDATVSQIPLGRLGTPAEIAGVAAFLAGPDGAWVTGQVLRANGGRQ